MTQTLSPRALVSVIPPKLQENQLEPNEIESFIDLALNDARENQQDKDRFITDNETDDISDKNKIASVLFSTNDLFPIGVMNLFGPDKKIIVDFPTAIFNVAALFTKNAIENNFAIILPIHIYVFIDELDTELSFAMNHFVKENNVSVKITVQPFSKKEGK